MDRRALLQTLGITAAAAAGGYWLGRRFRFSGASYVQMGTSITAGLSPETSITPSIVGDRLGMVAINAGLPGACVGRNKHQEIEDRSLYCLVDAITSGDWSAQDLESIDTLKANVARLKTADFSKDTYLGLEYGTNDFRYERPMGSDDDFSKETFKGALNYSIQKLIASYPLLQLFLITPAWLLNENDLDSDDHPNSAGIFLKEYVDAMIKVAEANHVPCLDMWRSLGVNKSNYKLFTSDGTHPTTMGAQRRGEVIASFVNSVF